MATIYHYTLLGVKVGGKSASDRQASFVLLILAHSRGGLRGLCPFRPSTKLRDQAEKAKDSANRTCLTDIFLKIINVFYEK
jgi:hypothetical protein